VFYDHSGKFTPDGWATCIDDEYRRLQCDRVVPEVNNGGDMVEHTMRTKNKFISVHPVRATRGKVTRAEPIAALYEQGRIHHVGEFAKLEEQMTSYDPLTSKKSPDRMDALVWALSYLFNEESVEPSIRRL
jgi:phage terminase large subunit-like protein